MDHPKVINGVDVRSQFNAKLGSVGRRGRWARVLVDGTFKGVIPFECVFIRLPCVFGFDLAEMTRKKIIAFCFSFVLMVFFNLFTGCL